MASGGKSMDISRAALFPGLDGFAKSLGINHSLFNPVRWAESSVTKGRLARLREEQVLVEMELNESRVDEFDVQSAVNFALHAIGDASRFWLEASLGQKQRFQRAVFPEGLAFDGRKFETAKTCLAFSYLRELSSGQSILASRTGIEPVSPP
jgi:hypothetical protein